MTIRVMVVDDHSLVRHGLVGILSNDEEIVVVGEAATGQEAVSLVRQLHPDVVLMDVRMPRMNGLEAMQAILADPATADVKIVVLTTFEISDYIDEAMRLGASGFLAKDTEPPMLRDAVRAVARGDVILSQTATRQVVDGYRSQPARRVEEPAAVRTLTRREREVVELVASGLSNEQIGRQLYMSPATARTHVSRAMAKLGARDRAQLVVMAFTFGLTIS